MKRILRKLFDIQKTGLIYDVAWGLKSGEAIVAIRRVAKVAYHAMRMVGSSLIVAGLAGIIFTFEPIVVSEMVYRFHQATSQQQAEVQQAEDQVVAASNKEKDKAQELAAQWGMPNTYFSVYIPKIDAKAPIIENVDSTNSVAYLKALHEGVAHAAGSVFPGMPGATYLFAHSSDNPLAQTKYNTVFYLLRELETAPQAASSTPVPLGGGVVTTTPAIKQGDLVYVFFLDRLYTYEVTEKHIVEPNDVSWLTNAKEGEERLILQTCWPPGTALKRLILVAKPVKN